MLIKKKKVSSKSKIQFYLISEFVEDCSNYKIKMSTQTEIFGGRVIEKSQFKGFEEESASKSNG